MQYLVSKGIWTLICCSFTVGHSQEFELVTGLFGPIPVRNRVLSVLFPFGQVVSARFQGCVVSAQFWRVVSAHYII